MPSTPGQIAAEFMRSNRLSDEDDPGSTELNADQRNAVAEFMARCIESVEMDPTRARLWSILDGIDISLLNAVGCVTVLTMAKGNFYPDAANLYSAAEKRVTELLPGRAKAILAGFKPKT